MPIKNAWAPEEIEAAIRLYSDTGADDVAKRLGRTRDGVLRVLRANGVKIRPRGNLVAEARSECPSFKLMCEEAAFGSTQLLMALQRTGLRP
jgi:hypothetical protein